MNAVGNLFNFPLQVLERTPEELRAAAQAARQEHRESVQARRESMKLEADREPIGAENRALSGRGRVIDIEA